MNIIDYAVVKAADLEKLRKLVKEGFGDGWVPQGGVAIAATSQAASSHDIHLIYAQAMVKVRL